MLSAHLHDEDRADGFDDAVGAARLPDVSAPGESIGDCGGCGRCGGLGGNLSAAT